MSMLPRVTTNGGRPTLVTRKPWYTPIQAERRSTIRMETPMGMPAISISHATRTPVNPIMDPTLRSIPPPITTKVSPRAKMVRKAI